MARIGLKGLTYAKVTGGGAGSAVTYSNGATQADMMIRADVAITRDNAKLSADNHVVERVNGMTGGTITLELAKLPDTVKTALLGYTATSGTLTVTDTEAPYVGFGYITKEVSGGTVSYVGYWFEKVQFGLDNDNAETKGESTNFQTTQLTGEILGVTTSSSGAVEYYQTNTGTTEASVRTWLNGKAGIS